MFFIDEGSNIADSSLQSVFHFYKIADFGLSKRVGEKLQKIAGTPGYMAPELLKSESKEMTADIKSDIYSMGLIFY